MNGAAQVSARIAQLEGRMAGLDARLHSRGGGRVGSGIQAALAAATEAAAGRAGGAGTASFEPGPDTPTSTGPAGAWATRLPAAGRPWAGAVQAAAERHGLPPELLGALVWSESGFDPGAVSPAGAIGLGQLMPATAAGLGVDPRDPEQNLDGAARYLRQQLDRFGDTRLALAAYNAGPARVAAAGGVPAIEETTTYVHRVTERAALLGAS